MSDEGPPDQTWSFRLRELEEDLHALTTRFDLFALDVRELLRIFDQLPSSYEISPHLRAHVDEMERHLALYGLKPRPRPVATATRRVAKKPAQRRR